MSPELRLLLLGLFALALMAAAAVILHRVRLTPEERERRRRDMVFRVGRMADGEVIDIGDKTLYYTYTVMGVEYQTSQDVGGLEARLPDDWNSLVGPVTLRYAPRNPANSIVLCEAWSGLRPRSGSRGPEREAVTGQASWEFDPGRDRQS